MEILLEIIFELIFEGSIEVAKSRKISKWIRYPLIVLIVALYIFIIAIIGFCGIALILSDKQYSTLGGAFFIILDIFLIISIIKNSIKEIQTRKIEKNF